MNLNEELSKSLLAGYINQNLPANSKYLPQLIVNDSLKGKKVHDAIIKELLLCKEFWFSVAFITTGGLASLTNTLLELEAKGVKGKIMVSSYLNFTQPEALKKLLRFSNIELKISTENNFHSKGYLFINGEWYDLIIGSSNLTASALSTNTEWNLKISATPESEIIAKSILEFESEFKKASVVNENFIEKYSFYYQKQLLQNRKFKEEISQQTNSKIEPNFMQIKALENLRILRKTGKNKALLISATGTGKTFLSAFDVQVFKPKKFLFIVHRLNIAKAALNTYRIVFGDKIKMGLFSGSKKELEADFLFSTVQTISKKENYELFENNYFDYIVFDESHRAGAESYQSLFNYFTPKFILGMTATPERTDGFDIFNLYDYNIAYEIRLHEALKEEMLSPFHYYGVKDLWIDGKEITELTDFNNLISDDRINHILEKINTYGTDNGITRGLIFCSQVEECKIIAKSLNDRGIKSIALSSDNSEDERQCAIDKLESEIAEEKIDYILTRDIFNEGIDIPKVNQIILLRPTESAIVFVQQFGRGLRKSEGKSYLTVIDFIGNYKNNFLVPVALYGDTTFNKDRLRKLISNGSNEIFGTSTINFERIIEKRIYEAIDNANMQTKKDLVADYKLLKYKIGKIPMMLDFLNSGSRDPMLFVEYSKSYFNFVKSIESSFEDNLNKDQIKILECFATEINNTKRVFESLILLNLIKNNILTIKEFNKIVLQEFNIKINVATFNSVISNLNFNFPTELMNKKLVSIGDKYGFKIIKSINKEIQFHNNFNKLLKNKIFKEFLVDNLNYALSQYKIKFLKSDYIGGFLLYEKYSRKDVFRILNWDKNPLAQNVGGYMISSDESNCALFINYKKSEDISNTTKYDDKFISNSEFQWMTKSNRKLTSRECIIFKTKKIRIPLFIKKSNDEGLEFYYMGELYPIDDSFTQESLENDNGKKVPVVKINFKIEPSVEENLYNYITNI